MVSVFLYPKSCYVVLSFICKRIFLIYSRNCAPIMLTRPLVVRFLKLGYSGSVAKTCNRCASAPSFPVPEFDWDNLLGDENIERNIRNRKGVGDIKKLRKLVSDSRDTKAFSSTDLHSEIVPNDLLVQEALRIPNSTHPDVPVGDESQSRVVVEFNERRTYPFPPKTHVEIGALLKGLRTENVGATTGKKSYYLMNDFALLERALVKYAVQKLRRAGFTLISVPDVLRPEVIQRCGFETENVSNNAVYKVRLPDG